MKKFFKFILKAGLFLLFCFLLLAGYIFLRYRNWENKFEETIEQEYLITKDTIKGISVEERLEKFVVSSSDTEFLELEVKEFGAILYTVLDSYIEEDITVKSMYISPDTSVWKIFLNLQYRNLSIWVSMDLNKDNMQTAQLYTKELFVGPFPIHTFTDWDETINRGIADSMVTLNENGFVGRYIENIELLEDGIVIKGSRY